jgi:hypothetical protein
LPGFGNQRGGIAYPVLGRTGLRGTSASFSPVDDRDLHRSRSLHSFFNQRNEWLVFDAHLRPPAEFLTFLSGLYGLAGEGKVYRAGTPKNPIALLRLLAFGDIWMPGLPVLIQRGLFRAGGWLSKATQLEGRLLDYRRLLLQEATAAAQEVRP